MVTHTHTRVFTYYWWIGPVTDSTGFKPVEMTHHVRRHHRRTHHEEDMHMSFALQDNQQVDLSVATEDAEGNPTTDTGVLTWAVDDETVLTLSATTGTTVTVAATGKLGTATVTVTDAETDGENFSGSLAIDVIGGTTSQIVVTPGTPTTKA